MENARRAGRHLQRAQELLGFGSKLSFGESNKIPKATDSVLQKNELSLLGDTPDELKGEIFDKLDGESLVRLEKNSEGLEGQRVS